MSEVPLPRLKRRNAESHKGDFGRALLIGGSRGMAGAISLSGMAALRAFCVAILRALCFWCHAASYAFLAAQSFAMPPV